MYLQQLKILGFKSFGHKTEIKFADGVTAIVGPNGCGKTNVLDSLRWVLGEQRTSLLRSGKMEEIIFNGTRAVRPLNMAEVVLTIRNDKGILPTEYTEVQIARRLFRSGESEYLLNKVPCRRKDIVDLFLDTGMGAHSYSVIQMDMIDALLSDKPEERRFLFEEAAGITKYKQRKKAALRKLEATENDFLRLRDIHAEIKTRVNSLFRQHKKAERHQCLTDDIKQWELYLSASRTKSLEENKRELRSRLDRISQTRQVSETDLDQISAQLEADRKELIDVEHRLSNVGQEIYDISEQAHQREKLVSINREKISNAKSVITRNTADIEALTKREVELKVQSQTASVELDRFRKQYDLVSDALTKAEKAQGEADRQLVDARASKEQVNRQLIDLEGKISSERTHQTTLAEQQQETASRLEEINEHLDENRPRQSGLLAELKQVQARTTEQSQQKVRLENSQKNLTDDITKLSAESEELSEKIASLSASLGACEARRNLLEDMMLQYEGYESGLVDVMDQRERWPGITGTVGESFVPVDGLETALEAALGELSRCMICEDRASAEQIISYLKAENKGKVGILVPVSEQISPAIKRPEIDLDEFIGWLDSFVSVPEELKKLKEAVLSTTAVFKAGANVSELLRRLPHGFSAVSTDGIYYWRNLVAGGSDDRFPLFRRKEKVAEQEQMIEQLEKSLGETRRNKNQNEATLAAKRAESIKLSDQLSDLIEELDKTREKLGELDFRRRSLIGEFERVEKERQTHSDKLETLKSRQYNLGLGFDELTSKREMLESEINQNGSEVGQLEKDASTSMEEVSRLQVKLIETKSQIDQTESQLRHNREIADDILNSIATKTAEIEQTGTEVRATSEANEISEVELKELFEKRELFNSGQTSARASQSEAMTRVQTKESAIKKLRAERDVTQKDIHQLDIKINSLESETKTIRARVAEEYEVDITGVELVHPNEKLSDDESTEYLAQTKEKLRNFGAVNLIALEEYQTAKEREEFLGGQLADLDTAKKDLQTTISRINVTARELFGETFDKVRKNFQKLFVELFNGGEADIRLEDSEDPLESNIQIVARPRGKKILSITQMSSGERALTAISLLFSLYMEKPSPFCILDEIDAPLDDANCHRFLKIIKNFSRQTQFLIITHNKITMEAADNLYGITMQEAGISKIVAVKFNEADEYEIEKIPDESDDMLEVRTADQKLPDAIAERINPSVNIASESGSTEED